MWHRRGLSVVLQVLWVLWILWTVLATFLAFKAFSDAYPHMGYSSLWGIVGKWFLITILPGSILGYFMSTFVWSKKGEK